MKVFFLPYFEAIWSLNLTEDDILSWNEFFVFLNRKSASENVSVTNFLSPESKLSFFSGHYSGKFYLFVQSFLARRSGLDFCGIDQAWFSFVRRKKNIKSVIISSAYELSNDEKKHIENHLLKKYLFIEISWLVDVSLIGGLVCLVEDSCCDMSIKSYLSDLALGFGIRGKNDK